MGAGRAVRYGRGQYRLAAKELPSCRIITGYTDDVVIDILAQGLRVWVVRS